MFNGPRLALVLLVLLGVQEATGFIEVGFAVTRSITGLVGNGIGVAVDGDTVYLNGYYKKAKTEMRHMDWNLRETKAQFRGGGGLHYGRVFSPSVEANSFFFYVYGGGGGGPFCSVRTLQNAGSGGSSLCVRNPILEGYQTVPPYAHFFTKGTNLYVTSTTGPASAAYSGVFPVSLGGSHDIMYSPSIDRIVAAYVMGGRPTVTLVSTAGVVTGHFDVGAHLVGNVCTHPTVDTDEDADKLYVACLNPSDGPHKVWLFRCDLALTVTGCEAFRLTNTTAMRVPEMVVDSSGGGLYIAAASSAGGGARYVLACKLDLSEPCIELDATTDEIVGTSTTTPPRVAVDDTAQRVWIGFVNTNIVVVVSPVTDRGCPDLIDHHGLWDIDYDYPNWIATIDHCDPGYGYVGSSARYCTPGSTAWSGGATNCVVNATDLVITMPTVREVPVESTFEVRVDHADAANLLLRGNTSATARVYLNSAKGTVARNAPLDMEVQTRYDSGAFYLTVHTPPVSGTHIYELGFDGNAFADEEMVVLPDVFAGHFTSDALDLETESFPGLTFGAELEAEVVLVDRLGNPLTFADELDASSAITANLVVDGSIRTPQAVLGKVISSAGAPRTMYAATVRITATAVGNVRLSLLFVDANGDAATIRCAGCTESTYALGIACPTGYEVRGATCAPLECLANTISLNANASESTDVADLNCVCESGFTLDSRDVSGRPVCVACPLGGVCAMGLDPPVAAVGYYPAGDGTFVRCRRASGCAGAGQCNPGYEGYMCNSCSYGYYSDASSACVKCPDASVAILFGAMFGILIGVAVLTGFLIIAMRKTTKYHRRVKAAFLSTSSQSSSMAGSHSSSVATSHSSLSFPSSTEPCSASGGIEATEGEESEQHETGLLSASGGSELSSLQGKALSSSEPSSSESSIDDVVELAHRSRTIPPSIAMVIVTFQVVGIFATSRWDWSDRARTALTVMDFANISTDWFASECSLDSFHTKYAVSVAVPMAVIFLSILAQGVLRMLGMFALREIPFKILVDGSLFSLVPLLYIPLARSSFVLFDCAQLPNGDWVLDADPGVACFDDPWWRVAPLGMFVIAVFVLGVPAYFLGSLFRHRKTLNTMGTFLRLGKLYDLYKITYWSSGVKALMQRLVIVIVAVFLSDHALAQFGVLAIVFLSSAYHLATVRPYFFPIYNRIELRLTMTLLAILFFGIASHSERNTEESSVVEDVLYVLVIVALVFLGLISIYSITRDVLQIGNEKRGVGHPMRSRNRALARQWRHEIADLWPAHQRKLKSLIYDLEHDSEIEHDPRHAQKALRRAIALQEAEMGFVALSSSMGDDDDDDCLTFVTMSEPSSAAPLPPIYHPDSSPSASTATDSTASHDGTSHDGTSHDGTCVDVTATSSMESETED